MKKPEISRLAGGEAVEDQGTSGRGGAAAGGQQPLETILTRGGLVPVALDRQFGTMRLILPALVPAIAVCLLSSGANAQAPAAPPRTVSPVTVYGRTDAPKVVKSYPAAGQALSAGVLVLSVTFDQSMLKTGFDFGPAEGGETLHCLKAPRLLDDKRTFVLLCTTEPHKTYALSFNANPDGGFENVSEHRAEPSTLAFTTTDGNGPNTLRDAMKAAGLRPIDMPIQESPDRRGDKTAR